MTFKTFSDQPKSFTFTYTFQDHETAQKVSAAILGYMLGTYEIPVVETTIQGKGQLIVTYAEDKKLNKVFKRICDGFKDSHTTPEDTGAEE